MTSQDDPQVVGLILQKKKSSITTSVTQYTVHLRTQLGKCKWSGSTEELMDKWTAAVQRVGWWQVQSGESVNLQQTGVVQQRLEYMKRTQIRKKERMWDRGGTGRRYSLLHEKLIIRSEDPFTSHEVYYWARKAVIKCLQWLWRSFEKKFREKRRAFNRTPALQTGHGLYQAKDCCW